MSRKTIRSRRARGGFTLVELVVAIVILTIGVLGLASTAAVVMRQINGGAQQARAANVAQERFEALRVVDCATLSLPSTFTESSPGFTEVVHLAELPTGNAAIRGVMMIDTVRFAVGGRSMVRAFTSARTC